MNPISTLEQLRDDCNKLILLYGGKTPVGIKENLLLKGFRLNSVNVNNEGRVSEDGV